MCVEEMRTRKKVAKSLLHPSSSVCGANCRTKRKKSAMSSK